MKFDTLLIDGKNSLYRAVFAGHKDPRFNNSECAIIVFRFIYSYFIKFKPKTIHIFWDAPSEDVWRKAVLPEYKTRDMSNHDFDVGAEIKKCEKICSEMFEHMGFYQYYRDKTEADDLIYSWCKSNRSTGDHLIISSDGDLLQIPYLFDNVKVYNPLLKGGMFIDTPDVDPVEIKSLQGDKSDTIPGYNKVGPVTARKLALDLKKRSEFFKNNGKEIYLRNKSIIDLSACPETINNSEVVYEVLAQEKEFNGKSAKKFAFSVKGLMSEYSKIISPFKNTGRKHSA